MNTHDSGVIKFRERFDFAQKNRTVSALERILRRLQRPSARATCVIVRVVSRR